MSINCLSPLKNNSIVCAFAGVAVFFLTYAISGLYTKGAPVAYREAFDVMSGLGIGDGWRDILAVYNSKVSGNELIHPILIMLAGGMEVDHRFLMAVLNGVFAASAVRVFCECGARS
jgi:hypothetical protein